MKHFIRVAAWVLCIAALVIMAGCTEVPQTGTTAPTQTVTTPSTLPGTESGTEPVAPPDSIPATEPQMNGAISFFSLSMGEDYDHIRSMTAFLYEDGTVYVEYVAQEKKAANMDTSVLYTIAQALQNSGLPAFHGQDSYEAGEANASMFIEFSGGSYLAVGYSGVIPEGFAQGYDKMEACFRDLMKDIPVYVPTPAILGDVDTGMQAVIMDILTNSHVEGLDYFYIAQPIRDDQFLSSLGLSSENGIGKAVLCGANMMTTPFSIVAVTVEEGTALDTVCADFQANLDWAKWVCVAPSDALIATKDNMALCLLAPDTLYPQMEAAILADGWTPYVTLRNPNLQ